jgi:hypothetical protein
MAPGLTYCCKCGPLHLQLLLLLNPSVPLLWLLLMSASMHSAAVAVTANPC